MNIQDTLNQRQQEAVEKTEGPLLILAGAGSGKTRVLTHRIAYLMKEKGISPWNIMAITFTNKAAQEMRSRVDQLIGAGAESVWVSTFHASCVRILRRYIDRIGYGNHFAIYDADDQKTVMKDVCKRLLLDTKIYKERALLSAVSSAKDRLLSPEAYAREVQGDHYKERVAVAYRAYQEQLRQNNALDFDDLIVKTVELFRTCPEVLASYQERLRYIMVDEYQDTNTAQFELVSLLADRYRNLCVVGDDDQSIYKFRGANIENILGFEKVFPDATVIKLEQNYRSTGNILAAANEVIRHNKGRKEKRLWTEKGEGEKVRFGQFQSAYEEAEYVAGEIAKGVGAGRWGYEDCAILYRTNAQSRLFEEKFLLANIPYKIVGGINFYGRREIKDLLAYLKTVDNADDDLAVRRIINIPKRGIGAATIAKVQDYALQREISFYSALEEADEIPGLGRGAAKVRPFVHFIQTLRSEADYLGVKRLMEEILEQTGYVRELEQEDTDEARARIENIDELISKIVSYEKQAKEPTLSEFLEEVALIADIDTVEEGQQHVLLMTLHSAKGLEFPQVYLTGMEDGIFPGYMAITADDQEELEEERRLCYVGITRAMQSLTLTSAQQRMIRGETKYNKVSRFVREIPRELVHMESPLREEGLEKPALPDGYLQMKKAFRTKAFQPRTFPVTKAGALSYQEGDRVRHVKFGPGVVQKIVDGGRDYEVTVDFDQAGVKKMFAGFAKLEKI